MKRGERTKRVLLSGAGGFVGSHALRHLLENTDNEIVCPVTFQHKGINDRIRLAMEDMPDAAHRVTVVRHDLATPVSPVTDEAFGHIDYVLNFASESHVDRSIEHPTPFILNNVALMCHLLDWARRRAGLLAFVQISTDEVYGPAAWGHPGHREWVDLHQPSNPYSASKAAQESVAFSYWRTYGVPVVLTNTMNIIGETQDAEKFLPMVLRKVLRDEVVEIHASATGRVGSRYYLHARNQADGVLHALDYALGNPGGSALFPEEGLRFGGGVVRPYRFNITGEREVDNLDMALLIAKAAGRSLLARKTDFHESRPGHDLRYALDGTRMRQIGWTAPVPLDESVKRTVDWTLAHPEWLR